MLKYLPIIFIAQLATLLIAWKFSTVKSDVLRYAASALFLSLACAIAYPSSWRMSVATFVGSAMGSLSALGKFKQGPGSMFAFALLLIAFSALAATAAARLLSL